MSIGGPHEVLPSHGVSAVLFTPRFDAWTLADAEWRLVHHPDPNRPLDTGLIPFASEVTWDRRQASEQPGSVTVRDFLGLDADWPGPE